MTVRQEARNRYAALVRFRGLDDPETIKAGQEVTRLAIETAAATPIAIRHGLAPETAAATSEKVASLATSKVPA